LIFTLFDPLGSGSWPEEGEAMAGGFGAKAAGKKYDSHLQSISGFKGWVLAALRSKDFSSCDPEMLRKSSWVGFFELTRSIRGELWFPSRFFPGLSVIFAVRKFEGFKK
jgi:hypothetical protein